MTEIELNRQIEITEALRTEQQAPICPRRTGSAYRREMKRIKFERLYKIVTASYVPNAGYVDWDFVSGEYVPTGKYIKYMKNSNCQKWLKRETSRRMRNCKELPRKGNYYRRLLDYWWVLY